MARVTALAALLGAGVGGGLLLIILGVRGVEVRDSPRPWSRLRAERVRLRLVLAAAGLIGLGLLTGWPIAAAIGAALGWVIPDLAMGGRSRQGAIERVEAVASWTEMLRDTLAGARGVEGAITSTAAVSPLAIRPEVLELAAALERQRQPLPHALRQFGIKVADPTCDLVVAALLMVTEEEGGRLGELLGALATSARADSEMRLRVEAGRARMRTTVRIVSGTTVVFAGMLVLFNRSFLSPYDSATGQLMLAVVGACFLGGFIWLAQMARSVAPARLLAPRDEVGGRAL